jgi:hypothetical protein
VIRRIRNAALLLATGSSILFTVSAAGSKEFSMNSPRGRRTYGDDETFGKVMDQSHRWLIVEIATGAGPEGNLAILIGAINLGVRGFELYAGAGLEFNPANHFTFTARYFPPLGSFKPYVGLGYLFVDSYAIGVVSHNAFAEVGHKWVVHETYHVTLGVGVRWVGAVVIADDSALRGPDVDPVLLDEQLDEVPRWFPTIALRFSRAF